jgi:sporulation protein YlmC with PRC-barrel domain
VRARIADRGRPAAGDLGPLVSYLVLREGTPVYDRRGKRIGVVEEIVADTALDIFDGLVIHTEPLPGRHLFASVEEIAELHERGVLLSVERGSLRPPQDRDDQASEEPADGRLRALLRRAWDRLGGA